VWIGSLIRALADFGVSERLVRTSVFRLARDGWLDGERIGRRSFYRLTEDGAGRFREATHRIYGEPRQSWSGEWCLLLTAAVPPDRREPLRRELSWLGFGPIAADVMAHPAPEPADLESLLKRLGALGDVAIMNARAAGGLGNGALRELVRRSWNLADIEARYAAFLGRFRPVFRAADGARDVEPRTAFQVRTLLLQEYRKVLLRDPLLPAELLPEGWHGVPAYQLCRNLYRRVYRAADEFMSRTMETADGPLPPPAPEFYERFGGL
jgi:phenylacetic acid degradation operon negative regulatory protein